MLHNHYGDASYWAPPSPDGPHSAVTRDTDDRNAPPRLRPNNQLSSSSAYASAMATAFSLPQRDSYLPQHQSDGDCSGQFAYPQQQFISSVNYASPPFDFAEYPTIPSGAYHYNGQYATQASAVTRYEYPPSDPNSFHHIAYDPTAYFTADGQYCPPLDGQQQQSLMSHPSGYLRCDDSFDRHNTVVQHPMLPLPSSSSSSELGNALGEIASPDAQTMNRALIALPGLPRASQTAHEHDSQTSESTIGHNPVKTEYDATAGGQSFSPLNSPSVTGDHVPYTKEEDQEQMCAGTSSMPRSSPPLHGHGFLRHRQNTLESFRLVQDPAAYPGFASTGKRHPPPPSPLSIPGPLAYSPGGARIPTPLSASFSSSDTGTPTSSVTLLDTTAGSSSIAASTLVPNPKAGQGVLKLPSTKRSARRKPAIACLFCRERKIACGAPPVGSADSTCNQCARRSRKCEYPTMSRRGLHKRRDNGGGHHRESEDADYVPTT